MTLTERGDSELTFVAGDLVAVDGTVEGADDWSWGVLHGKRGMFPTVFVELCLAIDIYKCHKL